MEPPAPVVPGGALRPVAVVLAILIAVLFLDPPGSSLIDPDESRYAEIAREMSASGDFVSPRLNGTAYWEKPPLLYWASAAAVRFIGRRDWAARLPVRLAALGTAALLLLFGGARPAGAWAALLFLSAPMGFLMGRYLLTDMLLCACTTLSILLLHRVLAEHERGRRSALLCAALGASVALAVLAKGLVGLAIPGLLLLAWCGLLGRWPAFRSVLVSPAPPVFVALAAPWFVLMERANPGFCEFFFVGEHIGRFAAGRVRHGDPAWQVPAVFLVGFLPWSFHLGAALRPLLVRSRAALRARSDDLWFALWTVLPVLFFTVSRSRLATYVLPAIPGAAMLVGRRLALPGGPRRAPIVAHAVLWSLAAVAGTVFAVGGSLGAAGRLAPWAAAAAGLVVTGSWLAVLAARRDSRRGAVVLAATMASLYLVVDLAFPDLARVRSAREVAVASAHEPGAEVYMYECFAANLPWTLGRTVPVVGYDGELASDGARPGEVFVPEREFWRRWDSDARVLAVLRPRDRAPFAAPGRRLPRVVSGDIESAAGFVLVANYGP